MQLITSSEKAAFIPVHAVMNLNLNTVEMEKRLYNNTCLQGV